MIQKESAIASVRRVVTNGFAKKSRALPSAARLVVFRSNKNIEAQIIDDVKGVTLVASSSEPT
jgi:ribosomal protein L18